MQQHTTSSIAALSAHEIDQVSGAGLFSSLIGSTLHTANVLTNQILNTAVISSVGQTFNLLGPVGTGIHVAADTGGYLLFQTVEAVAVALDGPQDPVPYHYDTEWA